MTKIIGEDQMKRDARQLKDQFGSLNMGQCYEKMARDNGFRTYAAMREALKSGNFKYVHGLGVVVV